MNKGHIYFEFHLDEPRRAINFYSRGLLGNSPKSQGSQLLIGQLKLAAPAVAC